MGVSDLFKGFQEAIGIRESEPQVLSGDTIDNNALSNNDAKVISNSLSNIYNNIDANGKLKISFKKVEGDSGIELLRNTLYSDNISQVLQGADLSGLEGKYQIQVSEKNFDPNSAEGAKGLYSKTYRRANPTLSINEINSLADQNIQYDNLISLGVNETDAYNLVIDRFDKNDGLIENSLEGIIGGFAGGLTDAGASITSLAGRIPFMPDNSLKPLSQALYRESAKLSLNDGSLVSNLGAGAGFGASFLLGGVAGKGASLATRGLGIGGKLSSRVGKLTTNASATGLVLPSSIEHNILQKLDRGEEVGGRDIGNVILDSTALLLNAGIRNLPFAAPLKQYYNKSPLTANAVETVIFEGATWALNPELTWQQQVGNLVSGMAFNVATTTGLRTQEAQQLQSFIEDATFVLNNNQSGDPVTAIATLNNKYDFNGYTPEQLYKDVVVQGESKIASGEQINALEILNNSYLTREARQKFEIDMSSTGENQNRKTYNQYLNENVRIANNRVNISNFKLQSSQVDIGQIRERSIQSARINELSQKIDKLNASEVSNQQELLKVQRNDLKDAGKTEQLAVVKKEINRLGGILSQDRKLRKELNSINEDSIAPNVDLKTSLVYDNIDPELITLLDEKNLPMDFLASEITTKLTGGSELIKEQTIAQKGGKTNQFLAENEVLYNKTPIRGDSGEIEGYNFIARISSADTEAQPITISKKQYDDAKAQNTRAQKSQYEKMFRDVRTSLNSTLKPIRSKALVEAKKLYKDIKKGKELNNKLINDYVRKAEETEYKRINENIVKAWINNMTIKLGGNPSGRKHISRILKEKPFANIKDADGLQAWFSNATTKIEKEMVKIQSEMDRKIKKDNREFQKNRKKRLIAFEKAAKKDDNKVMKNISRLLNEDRDILTQKHVQYTTALQTVLDNPNIDVADYQVLADARARFDEEVTAFKLGRKKSVLEKEQEIESIIESAVDGIDIQKDGAFREAFTDLSRGQSVIFNMGKGGRIIQDATQKAAAQSQQLHDRFFGIMTTLDKNLVENGLTNKDFAMYAQYRRSISVRNNALKQGKKENENFNNGILRDEKGEIYGSQNNFWIDQDGRFEFTKDFEKEDVEGALKSGWRPATEKDMSELETKVNNLRANDDSPTGLDATLTALSDINRYVGQQLQQKAFQEGRPIPKIEDEYLVSRTWIHTASKDAISSAGFETPGAQGVVLNERILEEANQQSGRLVMNMDESIQHKKFSDFSFLVTHGDLLTKILPGIADSKKLKKTRQGQYLKQYAKNIHTIQNQRQSAWEKVVSRGLKIGVLSKLGLHITQLVTQKFIYFTMPVTNFSLFKEIVKSKFRVLDKNEFSTNELGQIVPAFSRRVQSQSSSTSLIDSQSGHGVQGKTRGLFGIIEEGLMSFSSVADAKVASDVAQAGIFKHAKDYMEKLGIPYSRDAVRKLMTRGELDGITKEEALALRESISYGASGDVDNIMVSNTIENASTFQAKHPILAAFEFFLARSALGEFTRVTDLAVSISKDKNQFKKRIVIAMGAAGLLAAAATSKELGLGYAIMANEAAREIANEDGIDLPDSSLLIENSIAANMILYYSTEDGEDREAIARRIALPKITWDTFKATAGVLPFSSTVLGEQAFGKSIPQSILDAAEFAIKAEKGTDRYSQFQETASILAPAMYKPETQQWKHQARLQRQFDKENTTRRQEGKKLYSYEEWETIQIDKETAKNVKKSRAEQESLLYDYIISDPIQYLRGLQSIYPTKKPNELSIIAANNMIDEELLIRDHANNTVIQDGNYEAWVRYSKLGNRRDRTILTAIQKYMSPEDKPDTDVDIYFPKYITGKSKEQAYKYIMSDLENGLISKRQAQNLMEYAIKVWYSGQ